MPVVHQHFIGHRRGGEDHVQVILALQAFLDDLHVEQAQETSPEAKTQRLRGLRLEGQRGIVELQFVQRFAQVLVIIRFGRVDAGKDHRLGCPVAWQRLQGGTGGAGDRITDAGVMDGLQPGGNIAHLARRQSLAPVSAWEQRSPPRSV